jgi:hypothetical protein
MPSTSSYAKTSGQKQAAESASALRTVAAQQRHEGFGHGSAAWTLRLRGHRQPLSGLVVRCGHSSMNSQVVDEIGASDFAG